MIGRRSTMAVAAAVTLLAACGALAGDGRHHGHGGHGGNWWVAPAIVGGLLGTAAIAAYPYYGYGYRYQAAPYYSPAYPYPYPPQPRLCPDQYGGWYQC